ncbi:MAG TPA: DoxX family protein, partial [Candidatus Polarisedimenticolia bacterium]|nr:DoxX family protein [Candidatus Polarisedimenticolia bacterium]
MTQAGARVWGGRVMSWLAVAPFVLSSVMKFMAPPQLAEGFSHLGLPMSMRVPLAILEIACVVIDLVHATAVLGAILLTGFIGGAICTH